MEIPVTHIGGICRVFLYQVSRASVRTLVLKARLVLTLRNNMSVSRKKKKRFCQNTIIILFFSPNDTSPHVYV